jgi:CyaY protein
MSASTSSEPTAPTQRAATLTDAEFHTRAHGVLSAIEAALDRWLQDDVIDIDSQRTGGMLELVVPGGGKVVVNTQPPLHELWLAARTGGYHFRFVDGRWLDTRGVDEFFSVLSREISTQSGQALSIQAPSA